MVKNTHGGVLLSLKFRALAPWIFFKFFKLYKWYRIANCAKINVDDELPLIFESKAKDQAILEDHEGIALINRSHNTDLKHREFENLTAHKYTENPPMVFFMFFKLYKW